MIDNKRLSIIVPIYNVEKYLAKCIDSLLSQDFPHDSYEVIIVNDGSTDKSVEIANKYAAQNFGCVKLINQNNQGLSAARNSGIIAAKGKYLMFVDSDDYVEANIIGKLLKRAETLDLDILRFNYRNVNELYESISPYKDPKHFVDYSETVCDGITFLNEHLGMACYAWQFILKRELFNDVTSMFLRGIYFEDTEWTPRILVKAKRVSSVNWVVYNYLLKHGCLPPRRELIYFSNGEVMNYWLNHNLARLRLSDDNRAKAIINYLDSQKGISFEEKVAELYTKILDEEFELTNDSLFSDGVHIYIKSWLSDNKKRLEILKEESDIVLLVWKKCFKLSFEEKVTEAYEYLDLYNKIPFQSDKEALFSDGTFIGMWISNNKRRIYLDDSLIMLKEKMEKINMHCFERIQMVKK